MKNWLITGSFVLPATFAVVWLVAQRSEREIKTNTTSLGNVVFRSEALPEQKYPQQIVQIRDSSLHWEERLRAVRDLPAELGAPSVDRLFGYLQEPPAAGAEGWYVVCNEIMEVLRKRNLAPTAYTTELLALIQSTSADPMIRDYAAQHLAQWISGIDPNASESDPAKASAALRAMCEEAIRSANGQQTLAGTTLSALADAVSNGSPAFRNERNTVADIALKMVDSSSEVLSNVNRSTALQVAARLQVPELPQRCRVLALDPTTAVDVRLSAIAALGMVGGEEDRALLESFVPDEAFKFAAAAAIERVSQRAARP